METLFTEKNLTLEISDSAKKWLLNKGFDPLNGARPMAKIIKDEIKTPLADEILDGNLVNGGHVVVNLLKSKDKLKILYKKNKRRIKNFIK